jgi:protein-S-isoprenylcysteine O-methyltransferase Ste14
MDTRQKRIKRRSELFQYIIVFLQSLGLFSSATSYYFLYCRHNIWTIDTYIGLFLAIICYILWIIARLQLGTSFSIFPKNNNNNYNKYAKSTLDNVSNNKNNNTTSKLITIGLYSKFSNPIYLFSCLSTIGYFMFIQKYIWISIFIIIIPIQIWRSIIEAKQLELTFGKEYIDYKTKLWV